MIDSSNNSDNASALKVAFWNLQNLFDLDPSIIASELEFTAVNGWDRRALEAKITGLAEVIRGMFDGDGPDLLGICEIENKRLAEILIKAIGRDDYAVAHVEHPDIRGIDTSLIYSTEKFELNEELTRGHLVHLRFPTRDIFEVHLKVRENDADLMVLVNHWPSRSRGKNETEPYRMTVASHCGRLIDDYLKLPRSEYVGLKSNEVSLHAINQRWDRNVLVMGDLNDEPWDRSVLELLRAGFSTDQLEEPIRFSRGSLPSYRSYAGKATSLFNPMWSLMSEPDMGTHHYSRATQTMNVLDQLLISRGLYYGFQGLQMVRRPIRNGEDPDDEGQSRVPQVNVFRPEIMTTRKGRPREFRKESRSGVSDHFPITAELALSLIHI